MSVEFLTQEPARVLCNLGNERATLFVEITKAVARVYEVSEPLSSIESSQCLVNEANFCLLVERVFGKPSAILHPWAQEAVPIYETIKNEIFRWEWWPSAFPVELFQPYRQYRADSLPWRGRSVGSKQPW